MGGSPENDSELLANLAAVVLDLSNLSLAQASDLLTARADAFAKANTLVAEAQPPEDVQLRVLADFAGAVDNVLRSRWPDYFAEALPNRLTWTDISPKAMRKRAAF